MPLSPNTTFAHYTIISKIGAGGMGEVYLAQDSSELGRIVALKILAAEVAKDKDRLQRFIQEARTVSNLNHPNILTVHEFGQTDDASFMATEFVDGVTLRKHLSTRRLKLIDVLDVAIQIAAALNAAHDAGVTHRDLKPENVMVRKDHIVKVLDFGLAKPTVSSGDQAIDSEAGTKVFVQTEPGLVMGTVSYMSPEQSVGKGVDQRTDIWSLGVVLYEMLSGSVPFTGKDIHRQIIAIQESEPMPLAQQVKGVPERLEEIVTKCLAKEKDERYQTAKDLLIDLRNLRRKLDLDAEIERTVAPAFRSTSAGESPSTQRPISTNVAASETSASRASSAEYIVTGIRQHKLGVAIVTLLLIAAGIGAFLVFRNRPANAAINSIAVMPFVNESGNGDVEYLSDGMTETLIKSLSLLPDLAVKSRSTVFTYKGKQTTPRNIGNELNVESVLVGHLVGGRGDQLHLTLELVDTRTENVIWTDDYDRRPSELIALQNLIAHDVSAKLRPQLSRADQQKLIKNYTSDPEAYRLYLQGRFYLNKRVGKLYDQSESYFQQAIQRDPNFALGYAALAEFISERDRPKAKEYIMRAVALDNQLSDAHSTLGYQLMLDYDFAASGRELERAIELDPKNARAYQANGWRLMMFGKYDESLASLDRAIEIEPTLPDIRNNRAACLVAAGKTDEGIAYIKETMKLDPTFAWTHSHISFLYRMKGDHAASVDERARADELLDMPENAKRLRESFATAGWQAYLRELVSQDWGSLGSSQTRRASLLAELGEKEKAIIFLNEAAARGDSWLFSIKYDPAFDSLRDDPRFQALLKKFDPSK
jgi:serine/threonine-protein kinase